PPARGQPLAVPVDGPALVLGPQDVRRGPGVVRPGGDGGGEAVDPEHAGVGRTGTALAGLERHLPPTPPALQLGDEVRQPVVSMRSSGPVLSTGPVRPDGRGVVHRASAETYVIRYVRSPSLINPSATSRQPHRCTVAIADTAGVPVAVVFDGGGPWSGALGCGWARPGSEVTIGGMCSI